MCCSHSRPVTPRTLGDVDQDSAASVEQPCSRVEAQHTSGRYRSTRALARLGLLFLGFSEGSPHPRCASWHASLSFPPQQAHSHPIRPTLRLLSASPIRSAPASATDDSYRSLLLKHSSGPNPGFQGDII